MLYLRKAVVIQGEQVIVNRGELEAAGLEPQAFTPPKLVKGVRLDYPEGAKRDLIQGIVVLECLVTESGTVNGCRVKLFLHPTLNKAAIDNIRQFKYKPAQLQDKPRSIVATFMFAFRLY